MRLVRIPIAWIPVALVTCLLLALPAAADCRERLARVDAALADADDLDPQLRQALTTFRDQGAAHCEAGNEASAGASFTSIEMMLATTSRAKSSRQAEAAQKRASKQALTRSYLTGTWCAVAPRNNERVLWVFAADGSYRNAPSEFRFAFVGEGSLDEFLADIDSVAEHQPDRFVVRNPRGERTFARGRGVCHAGDEAPAR